MEKLIRLAYPEANPAMMEVFGIVHFIDALHEEIRLKVRQSQPKTLQEAVRTTALELQSFHLTN